VSPQASTAESINTARQPHARPGPVNEFETIYRANVGGVTAFFARRSRDPHVVADLTSETFVEAITSFGTFNPSKGIARAWLFGIARRVYIRHCERSTTHREAARQLAGHRELDVDEVEELVRRIDAEHAGRDLMRRWERLPPADRMTIELVDIAGLTQKEAATALGVSSGALRIRLFRARNKLRTMSQEGEADEQV
jgi:RNA polymerase sigma-70 factor (ECF subfamily)